MKSLLIVNKVLSLPYLYQRRFTLVPLAEIAPAFVHPVLQKATVELLVECADESEVILFQPNQVSENE